MAAWSTEKLFMAPPQQDERVSATLNILGFLGAPLMQAARSAEEEVAALCRENQRLQAQLVAMGACRAESVYHTGAPPSSADSGVLPGAVKSSPLSSPRVFHPRPWNNTAAAVHFEESVGGESKVAFAGKCNSGKSSKSPASIHDPPLMHPQAESLNRIRTLFTVDALEAESTGAGDEEVEKPSFGMPPIVPSVPQFRIGATSTTQELDAFDREVRHGRGRSRTAVFERTRSRARIQRAVSINSTRSVKSGRSMGNRMETGKSNLDSPKSSKSAPRGLESMQFRRSDDDSVPEEGKAPGVRRRRKAEIANVPTPAKSRKAVQTGMFANVDAMKEKIRLVVGQKQSTVFDLYKETGWAQYIGRSSWFDSFTLGVILANALWMGASAQWNPSVVLAEADWYFVMGESVFCSYFVFEWIVRFNAFAWKRDCVKDNWFIADSVLMWLMVFDTWVLLVVHKLGWVEGGTSSTQILQMARLLRLARMARMAKLMRALPELMVLIKGMRVACRSVFFTLMLLMIIIYVFSILFVELARGTELEETYFSSVPRAMGTLLILGAMPDLFKHMDNMYDAHIVFACVFLVFVLLASLTVMNMLVGVLCETVSVVSAVEKEHMDATYITSTLTKMMADQGIDSANGLSKETFLSLLEVPESAKAMQRIGVDVIGLVDYTDMLFEGADEISFYEFMDLLMQLRGSNTTTVKDIVELRRFLCDEILGFEVRLEEFMLQIAGQDHAMDSRANTDCDLFERESENKRSGGLESSVALATALRRDRRLSFGKSMSKVCIEGA